MNSRAIGAGRPGRGESDTAISRPRINRAASGSPNSPDSLLKVRLSREFLNRRLMLSTEAQYVSALDTLTEAKGGDYVLLHLTAYARDLFVKGLDASVSVRNLLNRQYGQPGGAEHVQTSHPVSLIPQDGRTVAFKLEYRY